MSRIRRILRISGGCCNRYPFVRLERPWQRATIDCRSATEIVFYRNILTLHMQDSPYANKEGKPWMTSTEPVGSRRIKNVSSGSQRARSRLSSPLPLCRPRSPIATQLDDDVPDTHDRFYTRGERRLRCFALRLHFSRLWIRDQRWNNIIYRINGHCVNGSMKITASENSHSRNSASKMNFCSSFPLSSTSDRRR